MPRPAAPPSVSVAVALALLFVAFVPGARAARPDRTLREARWLVDEVLKRDRQVSRELVEDARCLGVFPALIEAALGFGGRHGTGVASCRNRDGAWSPPSLIVLTEGSVGLQAGYRVTDLVLFFVSERAARKLAAGNLALGGAATVAAGPVDLSAGASTDRVLAADVYYHARSRGLFVGVSLEGSRLAVKRKGNRRLYGQPVAAHDLLFEHRLPGPLHPEALRFMDSLSTLPRRSNAR